MTLLIHWFNSNIAYQFMTREKKVKAINERLKDLTLDNENMISTFIIVYYLDKLSKKGLIENPYSFSDIGKRVVAICEEFDWKITDKEIQAFCEEMIAPEQTDVFVYFIKKERDNNE